jgi:hypothetical protein
MVGLKQKMTLVGWQGSLVETNTIDLVCGDVVGEEM